MNGAPEITCIDRIFRCLALRAVTWQRLGSAYRGALSGSNSGFLAILVPGTSVPRGGSPVVFIGPHRQPHAVGAPCRQTSSGNGLSTARYSLSPETESFIGSDDFINIEPPRCTQPASQPRQSRSIRTNSPGNDPSREACLGIPRPTIPTVLAMGRTKMRRCEQFAGTSLAKAASRIGEA